MSRLLFVALLLTACAAPATDSMTTQTPLTTTAPPAITTSTATTQAVSIQDCATPPVTFSALCEVYELLDEWHLDGPPDPEQLAEIAVRGLEDFTTTETEDPPRTLICAIPHPAFSVLCDELASRVEQAQIPIRPAVESALLHMSDVGLDPFTYYLPPDQVGSFRLNGIVGGVGVLIDARDAAGSKCAEINEICRLEIVLVLEDNPGHAAGLLTGDVITAIDGSSVNGRSFTSVVAEIAGDETGIVSLEIERDNAMVEVDIERAEINIPTVRYAGSLAGVAYVSIPDFFPNIPELLDDAIEAIVADGAATLVVDLRDNPGGYVDVFIDVADDFVDGGVVMISDSPNEHLEYEAGPGGALTTQRLIVLVNRGTASAAEMLAGALRDRRDAIVVGTTTFGKDVVQIPFTLRNGGEFHVVVARWTTPDGDTAGEGGLSPDREVVWPAGADVEEIVNVALDAVS
ncbi:MAG: S41 family peptidase [Acidimicrobiia bacterium]